MFSTFYKEGHPSQERRIATEPGLRVVQRVREHLNHGTETTRLAQIAEELERAVSFEDDDEWLVKDGGVYRTPTHHQEVSASRANSAPHLTSRMDGPQCPASSLRNEVTLNALNTEQVRTNPVPHQRHHSAVDTFNLRLGDHNEDGLSTDGRVPLHMSNPPMTTRRDSHPGRTLLRPRQDHESRKEFLCRLTSESVRRRMAAEAQRHRDHLHALDHRHGSQSETPATPEAEYGASHEPYASRLYYTAPTVYGDFTAESSRAIHADHGNHVPSSHMPRANNLANAQHGNHGHHHSVSSSADDKHGGDGAKDVPGHRCTHSDIVPHARRYRGLPPL